MLVGITLIYPRGMCSAAEVTFRFPSSNVRILLSKVGRQVMRRISEYDSQASSLNRRLGLLSRRSSEICSIGTEFRT